MYSIVIILAINFGSYVHCYQNTNLIEQVYGNQNLINENNIILRRSNSMKNLHNTLDLCNIYNTNNYYLSFSNSSNMTTNETNTNTILPLSSISISINTDYHNGFFSVDNNTSTDNKSIKSVHENNRIDFNRKYGYGNPLFIDLCTCFSESLNNSYFIDNDDSSINLDNDINYLNNDIEFLKHYLQRFE